LSSSISTGISGQIPKVNLLYKILLKKANLIFRLKKMLKKIKLFWEFLEKNKILITSSIYWLWIWFQLIMLMLYSGFQWFFYISLKFSIIIFVILLFLFLISIPSFIIFWLGLFLIFMTWIWSWWILWKILVIIYFLSPFLLRFLWNKYFTKKIKKIDKYIKNEKFSLKFWILIFILIFISFSYSVFWKKIVILHLDNNKTLMWELKFYNQEYYFLEVCNNKIIFPSKEVKSINLLWDRFYFSQKENQKKLDKLNKDYNNYCNKIKIWK